MYKKNQSKSPSRSVAKTRSTTPPRNRERSPKRKPSPARTKSPARNSPSRKSPGRKSPSRSSAPQKPNNSTSPKRGRPVNASYGSLKNLTGRPVVALEMMNETIKKPANDNYADGDKVIMHSSHETKVLQFIKESTPLKIFQSDASMTSDSTGIIRRSTRLATFKQHENELKEEIENEVNKILRENSVSRELMFGNRDESGLARREFFGWPGALLLIYLLPLLAIVLQLACTKENCRPWSLLVPKNWRVYVDLEATLWYMGFVSLQILLALVPVGTKVEGLPTKDGAATLQYRCNGILNAFLILTMVGVLKYLRYPVTRVITKTVPLLVTAILFAFLASIVMFVKGGRPGAHRNPYANGNKVYDFWLGREINPRFGPFDVKQVLKRISHVGSLVYISLVVMKSFEVKASLSDYSSSLLLLSSLQIFYLLDAIWFESSSLPSFGVQHEGTGYMLIMGHAVTPFLLTLMPKFILYSQLEQPLYVLVLASLAFNIGYIIYRASNNQKNSFRKNNLNPALAYLETIPAMGGRKLLCGGWWSQVRHPNYAGSLVMVWSWGALCGVTHWQPWAYPLSVTLILLHRAVRDEARCKLRYASAWQRYLGRVKYSLVPKLF